MPENEIRFGGLRVFGCSAQCPVCGETVESGGTVCPVCGTPHHNDCWRYSGGCAIYACGVEQALSPASTPQTGLAAPFHWFLAPPNPDRQLQSVRAIYALSLALVGALALVSALIYLQARDEAERDAERYWQRAHSAAGSHQVLERAAR